MEVKEELPEVLEVDSEELEALLERVRETMPADDFNKLETVVKAYVRVMGLLEKKGTTLERLRRIIWGPKSEKTDMVFKAAVEPQGVDKPREKRAGHGRNGVQAYSAAETKKVPHQSMQAKDVCPECAHGKLYPFTPSPLVRITGEAPLKATIYELEKLRCNGCGRTFQARMPEGVEYTKYDASAAGMIALLKYGTGMPFHRLENLEGALGVPLPAGTQWGIVSEAAGLAKPVHEELIKEAAQGKVLHNDDTKMKISELIKARRSSEPENGRKGCFTTGIVSVHADHTVALYFTGANHAGENLEAVLRARARELEPPIQMCDALACNASQEFKTILANCMSHARRKFVEVSDNFPTECKYLLDMLGDVYQNDAVAKGQQMSDEARLAYHQARSAPVMEALEKWAKELLDERKVEPNSGLGEALTYLLKHWQELTLFLRRAGAPLDNNICERALKKAILHRKNALFYKTVNGAHVGDLFMSLIHTAELNHANPFEYLTELLRNHKDVAANPGQWMPWNYRAALERLAASQAAAPPG